MSTSPQHSPPPPAKRQRTKALYHEERLFSTYPNEALVPQGETDDAVFHDANSSSKASEDSGSKDVSEGSTFAPNPKRVSRKPRATALNALKPTTRDSKVEKCRAPASRTRNLGSRSSEKIGSRNTNNVASKPPRDPIANWTFPKGTRDDLRPIHEIEDIFEDMAIRAGQLDLENALEKLQGREIRVATMCSGTESPLLALDLIFTGRQTLSLVRGSLG